MCVLVSTYMSVYTREVYQCVRVSKYVYYAVIAYVRKYKCILGLVCVRMLTLCVCTSPLILCIRCFRNVTFRSF